MIPPVLSFHTLPHKTIQLKEFSSMQGAGVLGVSGTEEYSIFGEGERQHIPPKHSFFLIFGSYIKLPKGGKN